ncbi:MAG TPA: efflux RND transporter periplasmic adaptor subunit [Anaerolineales bacterium]|nr:efflux RND transporter periplasmic adaptor subunit [Anaerolineales bacterium]
MKKMFIFLFIAASLALAACTSATEQPAASTQIPIVVADNTIIAEGRLEPVQFAEIAFSASGVVSDVLVKEGQTVTKGQALIRLGNESDTNYAAAQLELASAQQAKDDLLNSRDADLAQAVISLKDAQEAYEKADNYLSYLQNSQKIPQTETRMYLVQTWKGYEYRYNTKNFKGPAPKDWIVEAENDLALKKAELDKAQSAYDHLKDGPNADQLPLVEARLEAAKAGVAAFEVVAPFDGVVADLNARTGGSIKAGEIAVTIADFSNWIVKTTDVTEIDVVELKENQPVIVALDAIPDVNLKGKVLSIGYNYSQNQGDIVYEVTILLTDKNPAMRWGMTAAVKFE